MCLASVYLIHTGHILFILSIFYISIRMHMSEPILSENIELLSEEREGGGVICCVLAFVLSENLNLLVYSFLLYYFVAYLRKHFWLCLSLT